MGDEREEIRRPTVRLIAVSGHCNLCQNDRVGRSGRRHVKGRGGNRGGMRLCERNGKEKERERNERVEEIYKGTRGMESAKRGKMSTITPPSVPSRFQVRARFMRLIPALFLASASRQVSGSTLIQGRSPIIQLR